MPYTLLLGDNHPSSVDCHLILIRRDGGYQTGHSGRDEAALQSIPRHEHLSFTHSEISMTLVQTVVLTYFCSSALYCWCYIKYVLFFSVNVLLKWLAMLNITFTPTMKPCAVVFCFLFFVSRKKLFDFHCCLLSQNNYRNWIKNNRHVDSRNAVFSKNM